MSVRKRINRYQTTPNGYDFKEVLKKGKVFYRGIGRFEMVPFETSSGIRWSAESPTLPPFKPHKGTIRYKFNIDRKRWEETDEW